MTNQEIIAVLSLTVKLLELYNENPFKIKAYQKVINELEKFPHEVSELLSKSHSYELPFTKNIVEKFKEIIQTGSLKELDNLLQKTPTGVIEMFHIHGLGPKKIQTIWLQLGIDNLGDLLHACYENRLKKLKGFGEKTQLNIQKAIEFYFLSKGKLHLHKAFYWSSWLKNQFSFPIFETGTLISWDNYVEVLEFVTTANVIELKSQIASLNFLIIEESIDYVVAKNIDNITLKFYICTQENLHKTIFNYSTPDFHKKFIHFQKDNYYESLDAIYSGFEYVILPQHRYHENAFELYQLRKAKFIQKSDIKGLVHCHSTYSDGKNTLLEMAKASLNKGYEYMVIADHSQSAFYANGLSPARLEVQWKEIDQLNAQWKNFKIFKGIEADILADGSLDYNETILKHFDVVIASIHSHFKMDIHEAMKRIIKAIENPYTKILGHLTGRLLLIREGYPVDIQKVIDACAQNKVAIEMNANPYRLDLDWKWLKKAVDAGVKIFINPDAHSVEAIQDIEWGVMLANKAFLTAADVINTKNLLEFEQWLKSY